jgi:hypothetical protein
MPRKDRSTGRVSGCSNPDKQERSCSCPERENAESKKAVQSAMDILVLMVCFFDEKNKPLAG